MPSCIIKGCTHTWKNKDKNIIMHVFPKDPRIVRKWLEQAPDHFPNVDEWLEKILETQKKNDNYRLCSKHFDYFSYEEGGLRKKLRRDAVPTIFPPNISSTLDSSDATTETESQTTSESLVSSESRSATPLGDVSGELGETKSSDGTLPTIAATPCVKRKQKRRRVSEHPNTQVVSHPVGSSGNVVLHGEINLLGSTIQLHLPITATVTDTNVLLPTYSLPTMVDQSTNTDLYWSKDHKTFVLDTSYVSKVNIGIQTKKIRYRQRGTQCCLLKDRVKRAKGSFSGKKNKKGKTCEKTSLASGKGQLNEDEGSDNGQIDLLEEEIEPSKHSDYDNIQFSEDIEMSQSLFYSTPLSAAKLCSRLEINELSPLKKNIRDCHTIQLTSINLLEEENDAIEEEPDLSPGVIMESDEEEDEDLSTFLEDFEDEIEPLDQVTIDGNQMDIIGGDIKDPVSENKFIVFESCLDSLISMIPCQYRKSCGSRLTHKKIRQIGSAINLDVKCVRGHIQLLWTSQPRVNRISAGNLLLSSAIVLSGNHFLKIKMFFDIINIFMISRSTHYRYQPKYIFPSIHEEWQQERAKIVSALGRSPVCLAGDGQSDSPGFSAKYCIYTMMETDQGKIVDFSVVQIIPPASSVSLEKNAFKETIDRIIEKNINVRIVATDRHVSIRKLIKDEYPRIIHQFDVWHLAKSVGQKILTASKTQNCSALSPWISSIKNHLWWCARNCDGNPTKLVIRWKSVLKHVLNIHEWETEDEYSRCHHNTEIQDKKWLLDHSAAFEKLKSIVESQKLIKDIEHLCFFVIQEI
ncbi:uncharacterized protein LOC122921637 [Bufo gargarizans]|uniref:uncharacterized protein LOC122921637 n=1 Tax=Bufo gargarizans TaxID=30331 RepID=UPI001CF36F79|nr:uncharacterized protein LOC122921637 [Bufo gargarizans]XP_044127706.1 uncharacterized protein LOC122921637 [Bufo gargarizans]XP_044127707.1 uncharacterized protein LOC122921637 [Bufo gargarizans]